jgi:hypothetical protein
MGKESLLDRLLSRLEGVADWVNRAPGYVRVLVSAVIAALLVLLVSCANPAHAGEPADNGAHSSPETAIGCAADLPQLPQVSPLPPPLPADEYPCQGRLVLSRISPVIPELLDEP